MIVTKEAVYFYQQTDSYLKQARAALTVTEDWFCINRAASNVSQAAEFVLKAALYSNSIKPSSTHNHRLLVKECRQGRIRVDSALADMDDQTLVMECWKILDMRVEKLPSE